MIQRIGGGRVIDHGPQRPYSGSRSVIGGTSLAHAVVTANRSMFSYDVARAQAKKQRTTPADPRDRWKEWEARHTGCECHERYGGQSRPVGYRERESERQRVRRAERKAQA
jgi:hypothetical protein